MVWSRENGLVTVVTSERFGHIGHRWTVRSCVNGFVTGERFGYGQTNFCLRVNGEQFSNGRTVWSRVNGLIMSERSGREWTVRSHMIHVGLFMDEWFGHQCSLVMGDWFGTGERFGHEWTVYSRVNGLVMDTRFGHMWTIWSYANGLARDERFGHRWKVTLLVSGLIMSERFGQGWTVWSRVKGVVTGERFGHKWVVWSWANGCGHSYKVWYGWTDLSRINGLVTDERFGAWSRVKGLVPIEGFCHGWKVWSQINGLVTYERFGYRWTTGACFSTFYFRIMATDTC